MSTRTWQARLQQVHDRIKRKMIDNNIAHEGNPTDCIRIREKTNDEGDIDDRVVESAEIVPIIFPPLQDIPYRKVCKDDITNKITLTSLISAQEDDQSKNYEIICPHAEMILNGDLIIRIMIDDDVKMPIIVAMKVLEPLGTFGGSMIIQTKYKCNLYNEDLDQETLDVISEMAKRRLHLTF